jgi:predicted ATP-dependent serine protease
MLLNTAETKFAKASSIEIPASFYNRTLTGCEEIDLMFGSATVKGLMVGSTIAITGTPGAGKSTFLILLSQLLQNTGKRAAIASGEETSDQLAYACKRLGATDVDIAHLKNVEEIANAMDHYDLMVVDSFQALRSDNTKLKNKAFYQYAQDLLISKAKETGCILVFVLHITTSGLPKGGTDIIHAVDVNMKVTVDQNDKTIRIFDVYKNRAGETKKHSATMSGKGLKFVGDVVKPVANDKKVSVKASNNLLTNKAATMILSKLVGANKVKTYTKNIDTCIKIADECRNIYKHFAK